MIGNADGDGWRGTQGFMNAAQIEVNHIQRHGCDVVLELL
jgi:hypothetical protein